VRRASTGLWGGQRVTAAPTATTSVPPGKRGGSKLIMRTGYEAVADLAPCPVCGSRKWWFDGQQWQCWRCAPCPDKNPITAELNADHEQ
jgi:hypothetical protein